MTFNKLLTVSSPPHIYGKDTIDSRMRDVLIALCPALLVGIYRFGIKAVFTIVICVFSAIAAEFLYQKITGKEVTVNDYSAAVTGLLLAFNLPPGVPFWLAAVGSFFAIIAVKQMFGGLGSNFMNPALAARAFLLISFPMHMTHWIFPGGVTTGATPLAIIKATPQFAPTVSDYMALFFGNTGGCIGEVSAFALLAGGGYLIYRRVINWRVPVFYLASFALFAYIFGRTGWFTGNVLYELLSGGLLLGAFFMATDYATTPITPNGKIIMGIGCGFLTVIIRFFSAYPEGVSFAILIMNIFVPLIDKYVRPRIYGRK